MSKKKYKRFKAKCRKNTAKDLFTSMQAAGIPDTVPLNFMIEDGVVTITPQYRIPICPHCAERSDDDE